MAKDEKNIKAEEVEKDTKAILEEKTEKQSALLDRAGVDALEAMEYSEKTKKAIAKLSEKEIAMANEKGMSLEAYAVAKKQGTLGYRLKRSSWSYGMIAPYFILFFFFTVLPVIMSIVLSFTYFNMLEFPTWVGWRNYIKLFLEDDVFMVALKNTLIFAVITGPISYFLCLLFAWIINEFKGWTRAFLTLIFYAPSICGNAYLVWNLILTGDRYGYLNGILLKLGVVNEAVAWLKTEKFILPCLIVVQLWLSLGTGFLSFIAGLQTVDKSLYEAAALDGVKNRWQELWYVTLPAMKPQLMFGAVMQITQSFAVADISIQLAGNPSVNYAGATVVTHLLDYGSTRFEMGYASAIATVLFLLMIGTNKLVQKILRRVGE
ncbi:MAG: sugar ABC transporter permease [Lachnospiraceae bacterium]|nr:sugar ABC transporter permease [Lachnospiraceae bacterium]